MASKKKYYDIESEYADSVSSTFSGYSFLEWLEAAKSNGIGVAKKKEEQVRVIENFIQNTPKIKPVKKGEEFVSDSSTDEEEDVRFEDIVSETLAQIYEEQGLFSQAAKVYTKLSLINPEKSDYFAARLKELKKKESELKK